MQIVCPSCSAEYEVPASRLKPGKMVRCARCGSEWLPEQEVAITTAPDPDVPSADPPAEAMIAPLPAVTAMDRLAASTPRRPPRAALFSAWVVTSVLLVAAVAGVVVWRNDVVRIWPAASRILPSYDHSMPQPSQTTPNKAE